MASRISGRTATLKRLERRFCKSDQKETPHLVYEEFELEFDVCAVCVLTYLENRSLDWEPGTDEDARL